MRKSAGWGRCNVGKSEDGVGRQKERETIQEEEEGDGGQGRRIDALEPPF